MYRAWVLVACCLAAVGCATPPESDPWENMNRKIFVFNEAVDAYALEPVATAWDFVFPDFVQIGIRNIFAHTNTPIVMAHDVLQGKPAAAGVDLVRFIANTIFGFGGLVDVASMDGVPKNDEDWGQTLGVWGVESGPYLMIPFFGPSTPLGTVGLAADTFSSPHSYYIPFWANAMLTGTKLINTRAYYLEEIDQSRADAFDYYIFVRDAYLQNRRSKLNDSSEQEPEDDDDLYYFDDFEE